MAPEVSRRKERSVSSVPAAVQLFFVSPSRQRLTRPWSVRQIEVIDSMQFAFVSDCRDRPAMPRRATVNIARARS